MKTAYTRKMIGAFALAFAVLAAGAVGYAQRGGREGFGKHRGGFARVFGSLDLTEAQQAQIKSIADRYRQSAARTGEERGDKGFDVMNGGTFDEAAVRAAAQARAARQVEKEVAHARMYSEMYAVLTSEQKAKLAEIRQQREQKRQERRAQRGANTLQNQ